MGIGLALVKRLVDLHGGTVTASSAGAGQGTEFRVTLPLAEATMALVRDTLLPPENRFTFSMPLTLVSIAVVTVPDLRWRRRDIKSVALLAQVLALDLKPVFERG